MSRDDGTVAKDNFVHRRFETEKKDSKKNDLNNDCTAREMTKPIYNL